MRGDACLHLLALIVRCGGQVRTEADRVPGPLHMWPLLRSICIISWCVSPCSASKHLMTNSHWTLPVSAQHAWSNVSPARSRCTAFDLFVSRTYLNLAQFHQPLVRESSSVLSFFCLLLPYSKRTSPIWRWCPATGVGTSNQSCLAWNSSRMCLTLSHSASVTGIPNPRCSQTNALAINPRPAGAHTSAGARRQCKVRKSECDAGLYEIGCSRRAWRFGAQLPFATNRPLLAGQEIAPENCLQFF
jgi:hypothetical protein